MSADKIFELAERGGYKLSLEDRQSERDRDGRGSISLNLTNAQYQKLKE